MTVKLVHAADLHLDSPLRGLARYPGAPLDRMRGATRRALENLVALCIDEDAKLLVLAGDLYDGEWKDYSTGLFFASQMTRLREADVQVVWIRGNHDAQSQITRHLRLPDNVRELACEHAETQLYEDLGIAVHGRGFATRAVTENLAQSYPERRAGLLNIGLLHTSVTGRPGHEPYAPCTLDGLRSKGYDYWALGHVHAREELSDDPWVVFPGNLQGRHAKETGEKGATLVTYDERGIRSVVHKPLDVVRYAQLPVDLSGARDFDDALEVVRVQLTRAARDAEGRTLAVRLVLFGASSPHTALRGSPQHFAENVRAVAVDVGGDDLWVEKIVWQTEPSLEQALLRQGEGALAELTSALDALREDESALQELAAEELSDLAKKLPAEVREGDDGVQLDDAKYLATQLAEVEALLLDRLLSRRSGDTGSEGA